MMRLGWKYKKLTQLVLGIFCRWDSAQKIEGGNEKLQGYPQ
jgi:hypothetical protein